MMPHRQLRAWRWSTTSCSTCAAASACSSSSATCGPTADIFTAVYDEDGTEGTVRRAQRPDVVPAAPAPVRADVPGAAAAVPGRDRVVRPRPTTTSSCRAPRRGRMRSCAARTRSTSAIATTRSATRGTTASARWRGGATRSSRAFLRGAFRRWRQWDWIAAQRTDRYVANSRTTQARIRAYFGREARRGPSAGRHRALHAGTGRRPLRGRLGADAAQADRRRRSRRSTELAAAAGDRRRRPERAAAAPRAGPQRPLHRPPVRRRPSPRSSRGRAR